MSDVRRVALGAQKIAARREARQLLKRDREERRAHVAGFDKPRYGYTRLNGLRTWLSAATSVVVARASWARFRTVWVVTRDGRLVMLVTDERAGGTVGTELERDELPVYLDGAEVMGADLRILQPLQVTLRDYARAKAPSRTPRITPVDDGQGDK